MICYYLFFVHIKLSYWFDRQELLQKANDRYHNCGGREKAAEHYIANKDIIKEKSKNNDTILSEENKKAKRKSGRNRYKNMKENAGSESVK